jgi:hypothetical protein
VPGTQPRLDDVTDPSNLHGAVAEAIAQLPDGALEALVVTYTVAVVNCSSKRTTRAEPIRP